MANFVKMTIIGPDERRYTAEVDKTADDTMLLQDLVKELKLPPSLYTICLIGDVQKRSGGTLYIVEIDPDQVDFFTAIVEKRATGEVVPIK